MSYKNLAYVLAGVGTAAVLSAPAFRTSDALLSEKQLSENNAQIDMHLRSVDDILEGTKIVPVCFDILAAEIEHSRGILFLYQNGSGVKYANGLKINFEANKAMAEALSRASKELRDDLNLKYLKFDMDCDPSASHEYLRLIQQLSNFSTPSFVLFRNGGLMPQAGTNGKSPSFEENSLKQWTLAIKSSVLINLFLRSSISELSMLKYY